jgi:hypothetical protein
MVTAALAGEFGPAAVFSLRLINKEFLLMWKNIRRTVVILIRIMEVFTHGNVPPDNDIPGEMIGGVHHGASLPVE